MANTTLTSRDRHSFRSCNALLDLENRCCVLPVAGGGSWADPAADKGSSNGEGFADELKSPEPR
jgi:hypothetical protein